MNLINSVFLSGMIGMLIGHEINYLAIKFIWKNIIQFVTALPHNLDKLMPM